MYRPNRVGPFPIGDLDRSANFWPATWETAGNFDAVDAAQSARAPHFRSDTVADEYDHVTICPTTNINLASGTSMSFGVAVSGDMAEQAHVLSGSIAFQAYRNLLQVEGWIGRLDAATVDVVRTAANNNVPSWFVLPGKCVAMGNSGVSYGWQGSFLAVDEDDDGHGSNPLVLGVTLFNFAGSGQTLEQFSCTLSLHKYRQSIRSFDAAR